MVLRMCARFHAAAHLDNGHAATVAERALWSVVVAARHSGMATLCSKSDIVVLVMPPFLPKEEEL